MSRFRRENLGIIQRIMIRHSGAKSRRIVSTVCPRTQVTTPQFQISSARGASLRRSLVDCQLGRCLSMSSTNRLLWVRSKKCVISFTTMYSKHAGSFFASSILNQRLLVSGLQVPHLVFIRRTVQLLTGSPTSGSHFAMSGGIAALSWRRYQASRTFRRSTSSKFDGPESTSFLPETSIRGRPAVSSRASLSRCPHT